MRKEVVFKNIVSNLVIVLVVGVIFTTTMFYLPTTDVSTSNGAIYKGSSSNAVSLMINVYWGTEYLQPMLDILESESVNATFFVGGSWVEDNEDMLGTIYSYGNEIGNHGYLHKNHSQLTRQDNVTEIELTHNLVKDIIGIDMCLFAPPSGDYDSVTVDIASEMGYKTIMWSHDTIDWRDSDASLICERATVDIDGGSLILMHPTESTVQALPEIISKIKSYGYGILPVSLVL